MRIYYSSFEKNWIPFIQGCILPSLVEISPAVLEEEIFKFVNVFLLFRYYLPLKKGGPLHGNKLESSSHKDALPQVWLKLAQWFLRRRFFNFINVYSLFHYYFPLEKGRALHLNKLETPSPKGALCQVWLILAKWFWRRKYFYFVNVYLLFHSYLPLEKGMALHLNKLESPSPMDVLCQICLKLDQWFLRRSPK